MIAHPSGAMSKTPPLNFGREQRHKVIAIANQIGKSIFTSKGGAERNPDDFNGCSICSM